MTKLPEDAIARPRASAGRCCKCGGPAPRAALCRMCRATWRYFGVPDRKEHGRAMCLCDIKGKKHE